MKRMIITLAAVAASIASMAAERVDTLYYTNGMTEGVNVMVNFDDRIQFTYPGESMVNVMSKDNLDKIVFRSGRTSMVEHESDAISGVVASPYASRLDYLREEKMVGDFTALRNTQKVSLVTVLSDKVAARLHTSSREFAEECSDEFVNSLASTSYYYEANVKSEYMAVITIVDADADGNMSGVLDYYVAGSSKPVCSMYISGNGKHSAKSFESRLIEGVKRSADGAYSKVYEPMSQKKYDRLNGADLDRNVNEALCMAANMGYSLR